MRRVVLLLALAVTLIGTASVAIADPDLSNVGAHRHFIQDANGLVAVGPNLCDQPNSPGAQKAFNQFHANVHSHAGVTGEIGPEVPAPGLHDGSGPEIVSRACSFQP